MFFFFFFFFELVCDEYRNAPSHPVEASTASQRESVKTVFINNRFKLRCFYSQILRNVQNANGDADSI
jgi:hypothetical protein